MADCPFPLHEAITAALRVLHWEENLLPDEMPPRHIWTDTEALTEWFARVEEKRKSQYGNAPGNGRGDYSGYGGGDENGIELIKRGR